MYERILQLLEQAANPPTSTNPLQLTARLTEANRPRNEIIAMGEVAVQPLVQVVTDPHTHAQPVRYMAAELLWKVGDESIIAPLAAFLPHENDLAIRGRLLHALARVGYIKPFIEDWIEQARLDPPWNFRKKAQAFAQLYPERAVHALVPFLEDPRRVADAAAVMRFVFYKFGVDEALRVIEWLLFSDNVAPDCQTAVAEVWADVPEAQDMIAAFRSASET